MTLFIACLLIYSNQLHWMLYPVAVLIWIFHIIDAYGRSKKVSR